MNVYEYNFCLFDYQDVMWLQKCWLDYGFKVLYEYHDVDINTIAGYGYQNVCLITNLTFWMKL